MSWDHGSSHACDRGHLTKCHQIERSPLFAEISSLNTDVLPFVP